jgi:hypothetical protein
VPEQAGSAAGFDLVPVTLFEQAVSVLEVRTLRNSKLEFEVGAVVRPGDPLLDLLAVVRHAVRLGHLVLLPGLRICQPEVESVLGDLGLPLPYTSTFIWSVSDCCGLQLSVSDSGATRLLVGGRSEIRFLRSYLDPPPSPDVVIESPPVCTDYSDFVWLWQDRDQITRGEQDLDWRAFEVIQLAKTLGDYHSIGILKGDAHEGNFVIDESGHLFWIDNAAARYLYGPAESAECATDLLPLMRGRFTPEDWYNFKVGYLLSWPDGIRVFDLIEDGDRTGWKQAQRQGNHQLALDLLDESQHLVGEDDAAALAMIADRRAWSYQVLGEYESALHAQTEAIELAEENHLGFLSFYILNLALLYRNTGHADLAMSTLKQFLARTDHVPKNEQAIMIGQELMAAISADSQPNPPGSGT